MCGSVIIVNTVSMSAKAYMSDKTFISHSHPFHLTTLVRCLGTEEMIIRSLAKMDFKLSKLSLKNLKSCLLLLGVRVKPVHSQGSLVKHKAFSWSALTGTYGQVKAHLIKHQLPSIVVLYFILLRVKS